MLTLGLVPAAAASQGFLHEHDSSHVTERMIFDAVLADLDAETDAKVIEFVHMHFEVEDENSSPHDTGQEFCCSGVGAVCGLALLQSVSITFTPPPFDFDQSLSVTTRSALLLSVTPPPKSL
tara:strand:- start:1984 stop:2349 length:366 start_codon:yes stop_codon:yes gene_type:complete